MVIDVWAGQLEIDEALLRSQGVSGISIRINNMSGGHHRDTGFDKQWAEAKNFVRFPYFVYNPWVDGAANFKWLAENMPADARSVAIDVEVKKSGYPPETYAGELIKFLNLCKAKNWKTIIYTAEWFLADLKSWPKTDYWWAQYIDGKTYLAGVKTWSDLKLVMDRLDKPFNVQHVPGTLKLWQFSGDFLTMPGTLRKIDLNVFYGTEKELASYFNSEPVIEIVPTKDPDVLPTTGAGLYTFSKDAFWLRPNKGPLVTPTYNTTKTSGAKDTILPAEWIRWLEVLNPNEKAMEKILSPNWGPTKGINGNGKLEFISLVYPGRNVVSLERVTDGLDGNKWGVLHYIDAAHVPPITMSPYDYPDLIHRVYGTNSFWTYHILDNTPELPILGYEQRYIEMCWLVPISSFLPRMVRVNIGPGLNIRDLPSIKGRIISSLHSLDSTEVLEVRVGPGGLWGRSVDGLSLIHI